MNKKSNAMKGLLLMISIQLIIMMFVGCSNSNEVSIKDHSVFSLHEDLLSLTNNGFTTKPNLKITNKNLSITVTDVYYDKAEIVIGYIFEGKDVKLVKDDCYYSYYCNDKNEPFFKNDRMPVMGITKKNNKVWYGILGISIFDLPEELPSEFKLKNVFKVGGTNYEFEIPMNRNLTDVAMKEYDIKEEYHYFDRTIKFNQVCFMPATILLEAKISRGETDIAEAGTSLRLANKNFKPTSITRSGNQICYNNAFETIPKELVFVFSVPKNDDPLESKSETFRVELPVTD